MTKEVKVLQGNYGYGWDDLITYSKPYDFDEIKRDYRDYLKNDYQHAYRIVTRRIREV